MKKKPFSINLIALCYLIAPFANVYQVAWINHWPWRGARSVFYHFSGYDWFVLACFPIVALGIYRVARWGLYAFMSFSGFLVLHNSFSYMRNPAYSLYIILLFHLIIMGLVGFFLQKHISAPYFNPSLKWWEHPERVKTDISALVRVRQILLDGQILDISAGGCFLEIQNVFSLGDEVHLQVSVDTFSLDVTGKIVWVKEGSKRGYGLIFEDLPRESHSQLKKLVAYLKHNPLLGKQRTDQIRTA